MYSSLCELGHIGREEKDIESVQLKKLETNGFFGLTWPLDNILSDARKCADDVYSIVLLRRRKLGKKICGM